MTDLSGMTPAGMRAARIAAGLSLRVTARRMGISAPYLSDLERGHGQITNKAYAAFCDALAGEKPAPDADPTPDPLEPLRREMREAWVMLDLYIHSPGPNPAAVDEWLARNAGFGQGGGNDV